MWELDYKESWALKNWCFWTVVLEKSLESPLDSKEIQPVHRKENQSWIFIGRTYTESETPIFWPPDAKNWLIWKDPDDGKDWRQEEKGTTEDEMVGWHHWLNGHGFGWTPGVGDEQGGLACCDSWGCKESDTTEQLNCTEWWKWKLLSPVWLFVTPIDCNTPDLPIHHQLPELTQTHVHWVGDAIQLSHPLLSPSPTSHLQSFPASGSFQMSQLFVSGGQSIGVSASASVLPVNTQDWSPLGWTGWISLQSKGLQEASPISQFKSIN